MTNQSKKILADALALPPTERAMLVEEILSSFDFPSRKEVDALWATEVEDRTDAFERGEMKTCSAQEMFDRIVSRSFEMLSRRQGPLGIR